jgi:hypothetical protein
VPISASVNEDRTTRKLSLQDPPAGEETGLRLRTMGVGQSLSTSIEKIMSPGPIPPFSLAGQGNVTATEDDGGGSMSMSAAAKKYRYRTYTPSVSPANGYLARIVDRLSLRSSGQAKVAWEELRFRDGRRERVLHFARGQFRRGGDFGEAHAGAVGRKVAETEAFGFLRVLLDGGTVAKRVLTTLVVLQ